MAPEFAPLVAFAASILLIVLLRPVAVRVGLMDLPNERKVHGDATPLVGGLAIYGGMLLGFILCSGGPLLLGRAEIYSFFGAGLILVAIGVVDDFLELSPAVRFVAQVIAALMMVYGGGVVLADLGALTPGGAPLNLGFLAVPFTVFATLGIINALNMCDGVDGLAGSIALTSLCGLVVAASMWGNPGDMALMPVLSGAIVGFLLFNRRILGRSRAAVFMGDAGSMFLGFALTWYAISLSQGEARSVRPSAALWFVMIPVFDTVTVMLRRILKGRSPFAADREHLHHIFQRAGFSVKETVGAMVGLASVGVFLGLATIALEVPEPVTAGAFVLAGVAYFWFIDHAWKTMRFLDRSICRRRVSADRRHVVSADIHKGPERRQNPDRRAHRPLEPALSAIEAANEAQGRDPSPQSPQTATKAGQPVTGS